MADQTFLQAVQAFEAASATKEGIGTDVCGVYGKVKPILSGILPFLRLIPVYGATVAAAITALMAALDSYCPAN
jgi:hypothetical protein